MLKAWLKRRVYLRRARRTYSAAAMRCIEMAPTGTYRVRH
jgi:hypothetical protein